MNLEKFNNLDINLLEDELISDSFVEDILLFIINLDIENMIFEINNDQVYKIIKVSQLLLNFLLNKNLKKSSTKNFIFQCNNCSKAFSKQEYLNNHIERRHVKKSLSENGIFPLAEQIKRYNEGLFVDSSSINDLKNEVKNLKNFFKETNEDLIKEKNARENLQKIIEFEIIDKLNFLQKTWSTDMIQSYDDNTDKKDEKLNNDNILLPETHIEKNEKKNLINQDTSEENLNVFLSKQTELLNKIGQSIEQFVKQNEKTEPNINLENFRKFIFELIHEEIDNILVLKEQKKKNVSKKFFQTKNNSKDLNKLSLHQFSIQNNNSSMNSTDEIVKEIDKIINEETIMKNLKTVTKNKKKIFPFKFLKSKSTNHSEEAKNKTLNAPNLITDNNDKEEINNELVSLKGFDNKFTNTSNFNLNKNNSFLSQNNSTFNLNDSKFNQNNLLLSQNNLTFNQNDLVSNQNILKLSKNEFNMNNEDFKLNNNLQNNTSSNENEISKNTAQSTDLLDNNDENIKEEKTSKFKSFILKNKEKLNLNSNLKKINLPETNENTNINLDKILKSALKKSNNQNVTNKLPKKLVFSDENIEFSAEENFSSETESLSSFNQIEQPLSIHKVIEKPRPAPRFTQQKSSYI